ncbi:RibD family protein [Yinghuangia aomiensis]
MSVDGYIDDPTPERLLLSNAEDFDRVDEVRASCDAILIGSNTIRRDNPRLLVNSEERRAARVARGLPEYPLKVTLTGSGDLDGELKFFNTGGERVVYCPDRALTKVKTNLGDRADVVATGETLDFGIMLDDLGTRGIRRLMVEGGSQVHTRFLTEGLADEIQLAIAPIFVGGGGPRFVNDGTFINTFRDRMRVAEVTTVGDVVLVRYIPTKAKLGA